MKQVIIYERAGDVHVVTPADPQQPLEDVAAQAVPDGLPWRAVDAAELPPRGADRARWRLGPDKPRRHVRVEAPDLEHAKTDAIADIRRIVAKAGAAATEGVSREEIAGWPVKLGAAQMELRSQPSDLIRAEAAWTGEEPAILARRIVEKAGAYAVFSAEMSGIRRKAEAAVTKATGVAELEAALSAARADADASVRTFLKPEHRKVEQDG